MNISLPFGKGKVEVEIPDANVMAIATPPSPVVAAPDEIAEVKRALQNPIGSPRLRDLARGKKKPVIIVSDYTRPTPSGKLVPSLLEELEEAGIPAANVSVVFAAGSHRPTKPEEMRSILGEGCYSRVNALSHDCDAPDLVYVGTTEINKTPVWINRTVAEADFCITVSGLDPHQSAGWSGSAKNFLPGVSGRETVMTHHSMSSRPDVQIGVLEGNPFREDLEQAAALKGLDFALTVILTDEKQISQAFAGHWIESHRAGVRAASKLISYPLHSKADIVLAALGGAPRDGNMWQTEGKGLSRVPVAVRDGGVIIMVTECTEGIGHPELAEALLGGSVGEIVERFRDAEFTVFGNKAFRIASQLQKSDIYLATKGLTEKDFGQLPVKLFPTAQAALDAAFEKLGASASVLVVPDTAGVLLKVG